MTCDHSNDPEDRVANALHRAVESGTLPIEAVEKVLETIRMAKDALKTGLMGELEDEDEGFLAASLSGVCHLIDRIKHYVPGLAREDN